MPLSRSPARGNFLLHRWEEGEGEKLFCIGGGGGGGGGGEWWRETLQVSSIG